MFTDLFFFQSLPRQASEARLHTSAGSRSKTAALKERIDVLPAWPVLELWPILRRVSNMGSNMSDFVAGRKKCKNGTQNGAYLLEFLACQSIAKTSDRLWKLEVIESKNTLLFTVRVCTGTFLAHS